MSYHSGFPVDLDNEPTEECIAELAKATEINMNWPAFGIFSTMDRCCHLLRQLHKAWLAIGEGHQEFDKFIEPNWSNIVSGLSEVQYKNLKTLVIAAQKRLKWQGVAPEVG